MNLLKPEYWYRPSQILRRIARRGPLPDSADVVTPWGLPLRVDPRETVGHALYHLGILDLAACEVAWRLLAPGETAVDVGANIGLFTGLFARRGGPSGEVFSFEPHPRIHAGLARHVGAWQSAFPNLARIHLRTEAASDSDSEAALFEPEEFSRNAGSASLATAGPASGHAAHRVRTVPLATALPKDRPIHVMKVDTEGHEAAVFRGARPLLEQGRVRDIVFEEHETPPTDTTRLLQDLGFTLFFIGRTFRGPVLCPPDQRDSLPAWLPPNYLATRDPDRARSLCQPRGWQVLSAGNP